MKGVHTVKIKNSTMPNPSQKTEFLQNSNIKLKSILCLPILFRIGWRTTHIFGWSTTHIEELPLHSIIWFSVKFYQKKKKNQKLDFLSVATNCCPVPNSLPTTPHSKNLLQCARFSRRRRRRRRKPSTPRWW